MRTNVYRERNGLRSLFFWTVLFGLLVGLSGPVSAADGDLDSLWSGDGVATLGVTDTVYRGLGVALQCDGKVVVAGGANAAGESGDLAVVRFDTNGNLDPTFGTSGLFAISFGQYGAAGWDVAIQSDGKIVVAGTSVSDFEGSQFQVLRLTSSGVLDPSFSGDGSVAFNFGAASSARAVAIQNDGRIVVVGNTNFTSGIAVARLTTGGALDSTFNGDGKIVVDFTLGDDEGWGVAIQQDQRILVVGTANIGSGTVMAVIRLLSNGSYDDTFGQGGAGAAAIDFGITSDGRSVAVQEDGKIVVAGTTDTSTSIAIARLTSAGLLDSTFSGDGMVTRDFNYGPDEGWDVGIQRDGRIVATGSGYIDGLHEMALLRFTTNGLPDPTLGGFGYRLVSLATDAFGRGVAIQPRDGKIVIAGFTDTAVEEAQMVVIRLIGDSTMIFASGFECGDTSEWSFGAR